MSREIRRVPLDFDEPLDERWRGYVNPHREHIRACDDCGQSGLNQETKALSDAWYGLDDPSDPHVILERHGLSIVELIIEKDDQKKKEMLLNAMRSMSYMERKTVIDWAQNGPGEELRHRGWQHRLEQSEVNVLVRHSCLMDFTHWIDERVKGRRGRWRHVDTRVDHKEQLARKYKKAAQRERRTVKRERLKRKARLYETQADTLRLAAAPPAALVNEASKKSPMVHDSINRLIAVEARARRLGVYGRCATCDGEGVVWDSQEHRAAYEAWEPFEPPSGDGWQVWETVSEGSPISPVFSTPEEAAKWVEENEGCSKVAAERFVAAGWCMSAMSVGGKFAEGPAAYDL